MGVHAMFDINMYGGPWERMVSHGWKQWHDLCLGVTPVSMREGGPVFKEKKDTAGIVSKLVWTHVSGLSL